MLPRYALFLASVPFALVAATACRNDAGPTGPRAAFDSALARWNANDPGSYTFVASRACECTQDAAGPVKIIVSGGTILDVRRTSDNALVDHALWFTIDGLFDLIEAELAQRPERVEATYHATRGYPIELTYGMPEVDAGAIIKISQFVVPSIETGPRGY